MTLLTSLIHSTTSLSRGQLGCWISKKGSRACHQLCLQWVEDRMLSVEDRDEKRRLPQGCIPGIPGWGVPGFLLSQLSQSQASNKYEPPGRVQRRFNCVLFFFCLELNPVFWTQTKCFVCSCLWWCCPTWDWVNNRLIFIFPASWTSFETEKQNPFWFDPSDFESSCCFRICSLVQYFLSVSAGWRLNHQA